MGRATRTRAMESSVHPRGRARHRTARGGRVRARARPAKLFSARSRPRVRSVSDLRARVRAADLPGRAGRASLRRALVWRRAQLFGGEGSFGGAAGNEMGTKGTRRIQSPRAGNGLGCVAGRVVACGRWATEGQANTGSLDVVVSSARILNANTRAPSRPRGSPRARARLVMSSFGAPLRSGHSSKGLGARRRSV
eukprot:9092912-Pyramimonas_sp.AAC.1